MSIQLEHPATFTAGWMICTTRRRAGTLGGGGEVGAARSRERPQVGVAQSCTVETSA
jgi:hypothetical protein